MREARGCSRTGPKGEGGGEKREREKEEGEEERREEEEKGNEPGDRAIPNAGSVVRRHRIVPHPPHPEWRSTTSTIDSRKEQRKDGRLVVVDPVDLARSVSVHVRRSILGAEGGELVGISRVVHVLRIE